MIAVANPPWLDIALGELGVREIPGADHEARILSYHESTTLRATTDETPWCAAFVCWCLERAGIVATKSAMAKSFIGWGVETAPAKGCVIVLNRGAHPAQGHVGFLVDVAPSGWIVVGGNQSDAVTVAFYRRDRLAGLRWPREWVR